MFAALFTICFFLSCPNLNFAGVTSSYQSTDYAESKAIIGDGKYERYTLPASGYNLESQCNKQCACNKNEYEPVSEHWSTLFRVINLDLFLDLRCGRAFVLLAVLCGVPSGKKCGRVEGLPELRLYHQQFGSESQLDKQKAGKLDFPRLRRGQHDVRVKVRLPRHVRRSLLLCDVLHLFGNNAGTLSHPALRWRQNPFLRPRNSVDRGANLRNNSSPHRVWPTDWRVLHFVARQLRWNRRMFALRQQSDGKVHAAACHVRKGMLCAVLLPRLVLLHSTQDRRHQSHADQRSIDDRRQVHQERSRKILNF